MFLVIILVFLFMVSVMIEWRWRWCTKGFGFSTHTHTHPASYMHMNPPNPKSHSFACPDRTSITKFLPQHAHPNFCTGLGAFVLSSSYDPHCITKIHAHATTRDDLCTNLTRKKRKKKFFPTLIAFLSFLLTFSDCVSECLRRLVDVGWYFAALPAHSPRRKGRDGQKQ